MIREAKYWFVLHSEILDLLLITPLKFDHVYLLLHGFRDCHTLLKFYKDKQNQCIT